MVREEARISTIQGPPKLPLLLVRSYDHDGDEGELIKRGRLVLARPGMSLGNRIRGMEITGR